MKKQICLFVCLIFLFAPTGLAESKKAMNPTERAFHVMGRGFLNAVTFPAEFYSTSVREAKGHNRLWPVTLLPRIILNLAVRVTSAVNDLAFYPWVSLYSDSLAPISEAYGLPPYAWQVEAV